MELPNKKTHNIHPFLMFPEWIVGTNFPEWIIGTNFPILEIELLYYCILILLHPYYIHRLKHFNRSCSSLRLWRYPSTTFWNELQQKSSKSATFLAKICQKLQHFWKNSGDLVNLRQKYQQSGQNPCYFAKNLARTVTFLGNIWGFGKKSRKTFNILINILSISE